MKKITVIPTVFAFCFTFLSTSVVEAHYSPNGPHYHKKYVKHHPVQKGQSRGFGGFLRDTFGIGDEEGDDGYNNDKYERRVYTSHRYKRTYRPRYQREDNGKAEYYGGNYYRRMDRKPRNYVKQSNERYGAKLCETGEYNCIIAKNGQSWGKLFPDPDQRDIVKRLNRINTRLHPGMKVAVPKDLDQISILDISPFDRQINTYGKKIILVDLSKLAWAAYDENGIMQFWGPASGGRDYCPDMGGPCHTIQGVFSIFQKKDEHCYSKAFPVDRGGGAPMPYCMYFYSGFAIHGSSEIPGYNDSHGCVRIYKDDAKWLNEHFVETPKGEFDDGTEVIIRT